MKKRLIASTLLLLATACKPADKSSEERDLIGIVESHQTGAAEPIVHGSNISRRPLSRQPTIYAAEVSKKELSRKPSVDWYGEARKAFAPLNDVEATISERANGVYKAELSPHGIALNYVLAAEMLTGSSLPYLRDVRTSLLNQSQSVVNHVRAQVYESALNIFAEPEDAAAHANEITAPALHYINRRRQD